MTWNWPSTGTSAKFGDRDRDRISTGLRAQLRDYLFRGVDAVDLHSAGRQRERDSARPDAKLKNPPGPTELLENVYGLTRVHGAEGFVVDLRPAIAVGSGLVVTHRGY